MMRARSGWRRIGLVLATLSLAIFAFVVSTHVHPANENPNQCPIWAAHGPAGAGVETPDIVLVAPGYVVVASDPAHTEAVPAVRRLRPFAARAPPVFIA
jgi:hypothetical protein